MVMATQVGRARVWICKDVGGYGDVVLRAGCGYIGLYKPENDNQKFFGRKCPSCGTKVTYRDTGEICRIEMEAG